MALPTWRAPLALALVAAPCGGAARIETLHTHCGVLSAYVDGKLWLAHPPLSDGSGNPPRGWGFNDTRGTWRTHGRRRAEFRSESGKVAHFVLAPAGAKDPAAGCE